MRALLTALAMVATPVAAQDWRASAVEMIEAEEDVVEAMFPQDLSLWISVRPDGSNRDGLAQYYCLVLSDAGRPSDDRVIIRILDAFALAQDDMQTIGRATCG